MLAVVICPETDGRRFIYTESKNFHLNQKGEARKFGTGFSNIPVAPRVGVFFLSAQGDLHTFMDTRNRKILSLPIITQYQPLIKC